MTLHEYISDMPRRLALAQAVHRSPAYIWQVATGRRLPSARLARAIDEATQRIVTKESLLPEVFEPSKAS